MVVQEGMESTVGLDLVVTLVQVEAMEDRYIHT